MLEKHDSRLTEALFRANDWECRLVPEAEAYAAHGSSEGSGPFDYMLLFFVLFLNWTLCIIWMLVYLHDSSETTPAETDAILATQENQNPPRAHFHAHPRHAALTTRTSRAG